MSSPPSFQGDDSASPYVTFHEGRYWFRDARGFWSWYDAGSGAWVPLDPRALDFPAYASSSTTYSSPDEEASALDGMDGGDSGLRLSRASTREPMASGTDGQPVHQVSSTMVDNPGFKSMLIMLLKSRISMCTITPATSPPDAT